MTWTANSSDFPWPIWAALSRYFPRETWRPKFPIVRNKATLLLALCGTEWQVDFRVLNPRVWPGCWVGRRSGVIIQVAIFLFFSGIFRVS